MFVYKLLYFLNSMPLHILFFYSDKVHKIVVLEATVVKFEL